MNGEAVDQLGKRAERLERQNRRLKLGVLSVLVLLGATLWLGAASEPGYFKGVEAEQLLLIDKDGQVRGGLWMDKGNAPTLALSDEKGTVRVALRAATTGPRLELYGEKGQVQASLGVDSAGPAFELRNEEGTLVFRAP